MAFNIPLDPTVLATVQAQNSGVVTGSGLSGTLYTYAPNFDSSVAFPSGTALMFQQSTAPTGWTKSVVHNDKALRVVNGSVSSGGSVPFTSAFTSSVGGTVSVSISGSTDQTTLSNSQIPSHVHVFGADDQIASQGGFTTVGGFPYDATSTTSGGGVYLNTYSTGGGGSHNHTYSGSGSGSLSVNLAVNYVDVIIGIKN